MSKKIVTVFGATGNQGGSVVNALLSTDALKAKYAVRAVTRDASKDSAKALAARGVEVVTADMNNPESLKPVLAGSHSVFAVTNFWDPDNMDPKKETQQGKNVADAAFAAGVKHLVWSSLPHPTRLTNGVLKNIIHFESKADVETYIEENKAKSGTAATYFMPSFFLTNLKGVPQVRASEDGTGLVMAMPIRATEARVPFIDVFGDSGKWVVGALEAGPAATDGAVINGTSVWATMQELADTLERVSGKKTTYIYLEPAKFAAMLPEAARTEIAENMALADQYSYYGLDAEAKQAQSDKFLLKGTKKTSLEEYIKKEMPW